MQMVVVVMVPFLSLCYMSNQYGIAGTETTEVSASTFTQEEAVTYCFSKGLHLPTVNNTGDYKHITRAAEEAGIRAFWISGKKVVFRNFKYVDGTDWNREVDLDRRYHCAFLDADEERFRSAPCFALWLGYLCQVKESDSCLHSKVTTNHIRIDDQCFKVFKEKVNWYEARWRCEEHGYQLAVIRNASLASQLGNIIRNEYEKFSEAQTLWIGLHREDFHSISSSHLVFWDHYQPDQRGKCIVARQSKLAFYWKAVHCSQRYPAICQGRASQKYSREAHTSQEYITEAPTATIPRNALRIKSSSPAIILQDDAWWFLPVAAAIVLIPLLIMICLVCRLRNPYTEPTSGFNRLWVMSGLKSRASSDTSLLLS